MNTTHPPYFTVEYGQITYITFSHPKKHNALEGEKLIALTQLFKTLSQKDSVRVIVLRAARGQHFCAGADIGWLQTHTTSTDNATRVATALHHFFNTLYQLPQPTLALAQGANFGGGIGLLACCDIVIAASDAQFCLSETRLGMIPATIAPYLMQAVGARQAQYWSMTGIPFDSLAAQQAGLIHAITPAAPDLYQQGEACAKRIAQHSPTATRNTKRIFQHCGPLPLSQSGQAVLTQTLIEQLCCQEAQEGIAAFIDKRSPNWIE